MRHSSRLPYKSRRAATPKVAISVQVPLEVDAQLRRLLNLHEVPLPSLIALALTALEQAGTPAASTSIPSE